ncbi:MAG: MBL fold metallo-hydrolase, partial [Persicimonas sp.]
MNDITFRAIRGAGELSANAFLVEVDGLGLLLDAGARPGRRPTWVEGLERPDLCWISHAHFDHVGGLAALMESHVGLPCLATATTRKLAAHAVAAGGVERARAEAVASQLQAIGWRRYFDVSRLSPHEAAQKMRLMAFPAGHIPGAAMLLVEVDAGDESPFRILYTGDFCAHDQPLVDGALFPKTGPEFSIGALIMEGGLATNK